MNFSAKSIFHSGLFKSISYLFYLVAVLLILLEITTRLFDPVDIGHYFELRKCLNNMKHDIRFEYTQKPGYRQRCRSFDLKINREGFRGPDFPVKKPTGKKRLLILGDSMVLGWGVPVDSIFPTLLQQKLNRVAPEWEVIPAGVISWNTRTEYEFLKVRGIEYQPDAVLLVIWANDAIPKFYAKTDVPKEELFPNIEQIKHPPLWRRIVFGTARKIVYRSYALTTLMYLAVWKGQNDQLTEYFQEDSPAWRDASLAMNELKAFCDSTHVELRAILGLYENDTTPTARVYRERYAGLLKEQNIPYREIVFAYNNPMLRNSMTDGHPNARAHRLIARQIFEFIQNSGF